MKEGVGIERGSAVPAHIDSQIIRDGYRYRVLSTKRGVHKDVFFFTKQVKRQL